MAYSILVIEDDQDIAALVSMNLSDEGYAVTVQHDGSNSNA